MWATVTFIRTSQTNPRTEPQRSQQSKFSEFARNWTRESIKICRKRKAQKCEHGVTFMPTRQTNALTKPQLSQRRQFSEFARNGTRELIIICSKIMARKCEQAWHSCQQDKSIHVLSDSRINEVSSPSSTGIEPVSWFCPVQIEWQGNVSKGDIHAPTRQTNPRTEPQRIQRRQFSEFTRNCTREFSRPCSSRMGRKGEQQALNSYEQDKPLHVQSHSAVNEVSSPSSLGIEPVSGLDPVQIEWQGNVSKGGIHTNKTNQSTYGATAQSTR
jgi:hypothetical protein